MVTMDNDILAAFGAVGEKSKKPKKSEHKEEELDMVTGEWKNIPTRTEEQLSGNLNPNIKVKVDPKKLRNYNLSNDAVSHLENAASQFGFLRTAAGGEIKPNVSAFIQWMAENKIWEKLV